MFCLSEQNGKIDMTFFTHDCFHFTIKGHEELAKGLWNNMVNNDLRCLYLVEWQEVKGHQSPHCHSEWCIMWRNAIKGWNIMCNRKYMWITSKIKWRALFFNASTISTTTKITCFLSIVPLSCPKWKFPHLSVSCAQFQPEGGKMIVSSFSHPISLICPPMVRQVLLSQWCYYTRAAYVVFNLKGFIQF